MRAIDAQVIKGRSEEVIRRHRGLICDWLPSLDAHTVPRASQQVARRALVVCAVLQLALRAPRAAIRDWIAANGLDGDVTAAERALLDDRAPAPSQQQASALMWSMDALWAFAWAGGLIRDLALDRQVGDNLASLCPSIERGEGTARFLGRFRLRPHEELFAMLDLYYRAHWWTREAQLRGQPTGKVSIDAVAERRKALEWTLHGETDWDDMDLST